MTDSKSEEKSNLKNTVSYILGFSFLVTVGIYINKIENLEKSLIDKNQEVKYLETRIVELEKKVHLNEYKIGDIKKDTSDLVKNVKTKDGHVEVNIMNLKERGNQ